MAEVKLPMLYDRSLNPLRTIKPLKCSYSLKTKPLSTANLTIAHDESDIEIGQYVEIFDAFGSVGVFRVSSVKDTYGRKNQVAVSLEHGICSLSDDMIVGEVEYENTGKTIPQIMRETLSGQSLWVLGQCDFNDVPQDLSYKDTDKLSALLKVADYANDEYIWTFDQSKRPWTVNLLRNPSTVTCECRMTHNVSSLDISYNYDDLCTRVYATGLPSPGYIEADTVSKYGVISKIVKLESSNTSENVEKARKYLENRKNPKVQVSLGMKDLFSRTGEPIDRAIIGSKCRITIPNRNLVLEETIVSISCDDVMRNPDVLNVELGSEKITVESLLADHDTSLKGSGKKGGGGSGGGKKGAKTQAEELQKEIKYASLKIDNDNAFIQAVAGVKTLDEFQQKDKDGNPIYHTVSEASLTIDGVKAEIAFRAEKVDKELGTLSSRIEINADSILSEVTRAKESEGTLSSRIVQTANSIASEVTRATTAEGTLSSWIIQNSDSITSEVARAKDAESTLKSSITQTASEIRSEVSDAKSGLSSRITQNASNITAQAQTISLKADKTYVDNLIADQITAVKSDITWMVGKSLSVGGFACNNGTATEFSAGTLTGSHFTTYDLTVSGFGYSGHNISIAGESKGRVLATGDLSFQ